MTEEEKQKKAEFSRLVAAYHEVLADPGKAAATELVLAHLMELCFFWDDGFDEEPHRMAYKAGRRSVWLRVRDLLHLTADQIDRIMALRGELTEEQETGYDPLRGNR